MNFRHIICFAFLAVSTIASAQKYKNVSASTVTKDWQGVTFSSTIALQENLSKSTSFSFMTKILKNEALAGQLSKEEMVTIFVVNDASFMALDEDTRNALLNDTQRVAKLVKFHTVPGRLDKNSIEKAISLNGGTAYFLTLDDKKLLASKKGDVLYISDGKGNSATIKDTNFYHKNGFFHMVEGFAFDTEILKE
jgi:uncharacterized surface protein with fasciclin (FAS1) repeats